MDPNTPQLQLPQWESTDDFEYTQVNAALLSIDTKVAATSYATAGRPVGTERFPGRVIYDTDVNQYLIWDGAAWVNYAGIKPWVAYTPTLHTDMSGAETVAAGTNQAGKYQVIGKTCFVQGSGNFTGATANGAGISLPLTAKDRILNCGNAALFGSGTPADQSGVAYMNSAKNKLIIVAYTSGFRDAAAANAFRFNCVYELP